MAFDPKLAIRVSEFLKSHDVAPIEEKKMFGGLAFMVDDKMCICVSGDRLMCRFDPAQQEDMEKRMGYHPMIMKGKQLKGYCYVEPEGFASNAAFDFWLHSCLDYNKRAKRKK